MARNIKVALELDNRKFNAGIKQSEKSVDKFSKEGTKGVNNLKGAFIGLAGAIGIREIVNLADTFTTLNNRLLAVTSNTEEAAQSLALVNQVAARSRNDVGAVASLFSDIKLSTEDLGLSLQDVANVTETFSKALKISGADTAAADGAIRQFGQALASGVLRGDEFNSINEANSKFMGELAKALGVTRGELREMAAQGVLTADIMLQATDRMRGTIESDFAKTNATIGESFVLLRNSFVNFIGSISSGLGATESGAGAIATLAASIDRLAIVINNNLQPLLKVTKALGLVFVAIGVLLPAAKALKAFLIGLNRFSVFAAGGVGLIATVMTRVKGALNFVIAPIKTVIQQFKRLGNFDGVPLLSNLGRVALIFGKIAEFALMAGTAVAGFLGIDKLFEGIKELMADTEEIPPLVLPEIVIPDVPAADLPGITIPPKVLSDVEKFQKSISDSIPSTARYKELLGQLNEQFGDNKTIAGLEQYNSLLDELKNRFGITPFDDFIESLKGVTLNTEELAEQQRQLNALILAYPELADEAAKAQDALDDAFANSEGLSNFLNTLGQAQKALSDDIATALIEGKSVMESFEGFFKKLVKQLISDALRLKIIEPILKALFGLSFTGGSVSGMDFGGSIIGGLFGGGKANGGPVMKNRPYMVGEQGPEMFVPTGSGSIMPNGGMGGGQVTYNINAVDARSFKELVAADPEYIYNVTQVGARRQPR